MSAIFDSSRLGTPANQIIFNDFTAKPIFKVENTHPTKRDIREQDVPIPNATGVADYNTWEGKAYWIIDGTMYPYGEAEYYQGRETLRKLASLEVQQADTYSDGGYVPYIWKEAGTEKQLFVKIEYVDGLGESAGVGYVQPFRLYCKIKSPVIQDVAAVTTNLINDNTGTPTGVSGYPLQYPVLYGKTSYAGGNGSVTNRGSIGAYPSFIVNGPVNIPRITNTTTGEYLEINVNLASIGNILTISYDADTPPNVTIGGVSQYNKVSAGSTFFKIKPGANNLTLTGQSIGNGANASLSFYSSYPMS